MHGISAHFRRFRCRALVQHHPERRRPSAVRAPPVPAELRRDVHLVEVRITDKPPESYRDLTAGPATGHDRVGLARWLLLETHRSRLATRRNLPA